MIKNFLISIFKYGFLILALSISGCGEKQAEKTPAPKKPLLQGESQPLELSDEVTHEPVVVTAKTRETYQW